MLRRLSAEARELWQQIRQKELMDAADRDRAGAIGRFYSGGELRRLLHPRAPAPHLYSPIPNSLIITGDCMALGALRADLASVSTVEICPMAPDSLCVSRILPRDLSKILSLVARERLHARIQQGQKQLVSSVEDRLCAWEHDLAAEGLAKQSECSNCGGRNLTPMTATHQGRRWSSGVGTVPGSQSQLSEQATMTSYPSVLTAFPG